MSVMETLKEKTWPLHQRAERHPLQAAIVRGKLPADQYAEHLGQMLLVHRALEKHLAKLVDKDERVAKVVRPEQYQEPYLLDDLAHFGGSTEPDGLAPTNDLIDKFHAEASQRPLFLLGAHYVLEGSNNGNRFIVKAVRPAYGLEPGKGDRYLDPYGDEQPAKWAAFKDAMTEADFSQAEQDAILDGANAMFEGMIAMFDAMAAKHGIEAPAGAGRP